MWEEIVIENRSKDLELERRLAQFLEDELNAVLVARNRWCCNLKDAGWSLERVQEELAYLVNNDPDGVVLQVPCRRWFWPVRTWRRTVIAKYAHARD